MKAWTRNFIPENDQSHESVRVAVRRFAEAAEEAASFNHVQLSDVKWIIPHQANLRMLQQVAKRLNVPIERSTLPSKNTLTSHRYRSNRFG
jgi:3-oxoacyl-[acyl-carrier-protein] synthase-3